MHDVDFFEIDDLASLWQSSDSSARLEIFKFISKECDRINYFAKKEIQAYCIRRMGEFKEQEMLEQLKNTASYKKKLFEGTI